MRSYYPDHIVGLVVTYIFFIGFFVGLSKTGLGQEYLHLGFIFWFFASTVISEGSISISFEKQTGTFEQLLLKPTHILKILTARTMVWFFITFIKVIILMFVVIISLRISFPFDLRIIPIMLVTLSGLFGFGLILSALTLIYTKTASFESIISYFLLFFTGGIISLEQLPGYVIKVADFLPLTIGIRLSMSILSGAQLPSSSILGLFTNSGVYLLLGIVIFIYCHNYGKREGLSADY
ncbi:hypothetical protein BHF71_08980 [Vulcanibacillus modesticaldus]|uniref:ABC-2 type transporter transmembrane domain-containing protein n=2 Tax=Vulcanibacillus modesticaldus TaxID=337097 RepID=A0A1D2YUV1_9BACI|nr:hypothetical protein BHF71_08980 [Vulcanibacillus modesticaldus]